MVQSKRKQEALLIDRRSDLCLTLYRHLASAYPHEFRLVYGEDLDRLGEDAIPFHVLLRLQPGVAPERAEAELDATARQIEQETHDPGRDREGRRITLLPGGKLWPRFNSHGPDHRSRASAFLDATRRDSGTCTPPPLGEPAAKYACIILVIAKLCHRSASCRSVAGGVRQPNLLLKTFGF